MTRENDFIKKFNLFTYRLINGIAEKRIKFLITMKLELRAKKRLKSIGGGYNGTSSEYQDKVLKFWSKYGISPKKFWYDLFCEKKTSYDPRFIPDTIWDIDILSYFNNLKMRDAYTDKGMLSRILPDVKKPETIVKNIAGYYYDGDGEHLISREEAERLCANEERLIIKPYRGMKGEGIVIYDRKGKEGIGDIFSRLKCGFVAQRIVRQHPDLASLNKDSVNTIRVISFHFKDRIHILSALLRIGGKGAFVDNVSSGGSACPVNTDGTLYEKSVNRKSVWSDTSPGGVKYKGFTIPNYAGIIETAKRLHCQLPYFNIIGWDFAVDETGEPVLLEFNAKPGQNQIGHGKPTFGDLTEEVLEDVFIHKTLKDAFAIGENE